MTHVIRAGPTLTSAPKIAAPRPQPLTRGPLPRHHPLLPLLLRLHFHSTGKHRDPKAGSTAIWGSCSSTRQESERTVFVDFALIGYYFQRWAWEDQAMPYVNNYRTG